MADRVLFNCWGTVVRGREERALEVFNQVVGLYGRLQQEGRIEAFDVALLEPNRAMRGYFQIHGSAQQLAALREDEDFRRAMIDAELVVEDLTLIEGSTNDGVAREIAMFQERIAQVPQIA
ncbi:MAG: hypothetical protein QOC64_2981 [Solirubrobacteraceae bacterium]|jgi:hypothetical protein|nr:hypothetical protein [Solirubrobacteraceae bacterium]